MSILDVMSAIGSVVIIILVLVLTYYATRWYARRLNGGAGAGSGKYVKILDRANTGGASSLLVVQVGDQYYLVGVGEKNVQLLCELKDFDRFMGENPLPTSTQAPFGSLLRGLMDRSGQSAKNKDDGGAQ